MRDALTNRPMTPQKWLKYELLHHYGLADLRFLRRTIHRFPRSKHIRFLARLRSAMMSTPKDHLDTLFVVKFVPMHSGMMLPNVRLTHVDDLTRVKLAIEQESSDYDELWFCQTRVSPNGLSVAGRVAIDARGPTGHVVEQVWRCSPRMIEILGPHFPYPFVRAQRIGWGWSPIIDEVHIPPGVPETKAALLHELGIALAILDERREQLELMSDAIATFGLDVCFEYKLEGRHLQIIDWDTPNDSLVIRELLPR
jgi:hypothetical protein